MAASVLLVFLMATLAVSSVAAASGYSSSTSGKQLPQYPSTGGTSPSSNSNKKVPKFDETLGKDNTCKGAQEAVTKAKNKCCNDLGKRGKCICPAVRSVFDSITFVQGLCDDYDACTGSWNFEAKVEECKLQVDKEDKAGECVEALKELKEMPKDCLHILDYPGTDY